MINSSMRFKQFFQLNESQYSYKGSCVNSFDEDGDSLIKLFSDVSDFAVKEEESEEVSKDIISKFNINNELQNIANKKSTKLLFNKDHDIYFLYDTAKDIHYFFSK